MYLHKVILENQVPVSAHRIENNRSPDEDMLNTDGSIKWIPVFGFDEADCIAIAREILTDIL